MTAEALSAVRRLWAMLRHAERRSLLVLALCSVLTALAELALLAAVVPFALALTQSRTATALLGRVPPVEWAALHFLVAVVAATALRLVQLRLQMRATRRIGEYIAMRSYARTLWRPYSEHVAANISQTSATLTGQLDAVLRNVLPALTVSLSQVVTVAAVVTALFFTSVWVTALVLAGVVGGYLLFMHRSRGATRIEAERQSAAMSRITRALAESLNGIRDVILSGSHTEWLRTYGDAQHDLRDAAARLGGIAAIPRIVVEAIGYTIVVIVACVLATNHTSTTVPVSILAVVIFGSQRLLPAVQALYASWNNVSRGLPHLRELLPLLEQPDRAQPAVTTPVPLGSGPINLLAGGGRS